MNKIIIFALLIKSSVLIASEPAYCDPKSFIAKASTYITSINQAGLVRPKGFKLGQVTLFGLAVGKSSTDSLKNLALSTTKNPEIANDKYCTWYHNSEKHNSLAAQIFNHAYVPAPFVIINGPNQNVTRFADSLVPYFDDFTEDNLIATYVESLAQAFSNDKDSFLYCAQKYNYIALGCFSQKHRGPTVFGSLLAFSGCSAESAQTIVNTLWDHQMPYAPWISTLNKQARLGIIKRFHELGQQNQSVSLKLQNLFNGNK